MVHGILWSGGGHDIVEGFDLVRGCTGPGHSIYNRLDNIRKSNVY